MSCSRCGGCLAIESSTDFYNPEGQWRCINCGARRSLLSPASGEFAHESPRTVFPSSAEKIPLPSFLACGQENFDDRSDMNASKDFLIANHRQLEPPPYGLDGLIQKEH